MSAYFLGLQGKDLLLQLEDETLKLVEPQSQALLHAQPIVSIRVWGVGRDSGRWAQSLGPWGGGSSSSQSGPSSLTLFLASLVLPDPERGTVPIYLLPPPTPGPDASEHPSSPVLPCPFLPAVLAHSPPTSACLPVYSPARGSTHRTPSEGRSPGGGCGCGGNEAQQWMALGDTEVPLHQQGLCLRSS